MLMLDLETTGLKIGALIPSIGWCAFDWDRIIDRGTIAINIENMPGNIDVSTFKFWLQQDRPAIAKTFFRPEEDQKFWITALDQLSDLVNLPEVQADRGVWGNGCLFDLGHLEHWYGVAGMKVPWHYRSPRDMRTFTDTAERLGNWSREAAEQRVKESHGIELTKHDAEDDAVFQALMLIDANAHLSNQASGI